MNFIYMVVLIIFCWQMFVFILQRISQKHDEKKAADDVIAKEDKEIHDFLLDMARKKGNDKHDTHYDF